ncbi:MAG TPA: polysaccharide biosynthesis/export family protein [Terriglobales bacterium]|nr:polysaccharide biosynthesis/export family protein [Terriglobales bacterium]
MKSAALSLVVLAVLVSSAVGFAQSHGAEPSSSEPSSAAVKTPPPESSATPEFQTRGWRYSIQPGDQLDVSFTLTPEFNQSVTVQPDGFITLRGAGDVMAMGKTLPEVTDGIRQAYSATLKDPIIFVNPIKFETPSITVGGEVDKPGRFDWQNELTVTQAVAMAGGFKDTAKHSQVLLFRRVSDEWAEARVINVKKMMNKKDLDEDPVLRPGDMLYVPKNRISKIKPFIPLPNIGMYANRF